MNRLAIAGVSVVALGLFAFALTSIAQANEGKNFEGKNNFRTEARAEWRANHEWREALHEGGYKNLGDLRSFWARYHENKIERLEAKLASTTDAELRAKIEARIDLLEDKASTTKAFMLKHEGRFSFFGWFGKLFGKDE